MTASSEEGWIEWNGGKCPVEPDTRVEIKLRRGMRGPGEAKCYQWAHFATGANLYSADFDIIAYRVVKP
jgi:hypothetical protein